MQSLEKFYKYKSDKKIAKEIAKKEKQIENRKLSFQKRHQELVENYKVGLSAKFERKLRSIEIKKQRELANLIRKSLNKKPLKPKPEKVDKIKNMAYTEIQKYAKLIVADKDGYIITVDTNERLKRNDKSVQAWHWRPKHNYPQLAFELDNIHPIKKWTNKRQADMLGYEWEQKFIAKIWFARYQELASIADNKELKWQVRDRQYYVELYEKYRDLNIQLLVKLKDGI